MTSRCFECGGKTAADRLTAVGDAVFCEKCFAQLLAKADAPAAQSDPAAQRAPTVSTSPKTRRDGRNACLVCEKPLLAGEQAMAFPGGHICESCASDMAVELEAAAANSPPGATPGDSSATRAFKAAATDLGAELNATATSNAAAKPIDLASMSTPGSATAQCAGCDRLMPGPGSYRLIEGKPYCAACVPFYSVYHAQKSPKAATTEVPREPNTPRCDCCSAELGSATEESAAQEQSGFRICSACRTTDAALAVSVARARHRHRLLSLSQSLGVGKDKP